MKTSTAAQTKSPSPKTKGAKSIPIGSNEILVRIAAVGLHHTDLTVPLNPNDYLAIMAHEGSGVVEQVGDQVSKVRSGDHVVLIHLSCGQCIPCQKGYPSYCLKIVGAGPGNSLSCGTSGIDRFEKNFRKHNDGNSSFSTHALVTESNVVKVRRDMPLELLGPLGYSVLAGAGAVLNGLHVVVGSSIAVFGLGTVGLSAVMAAVVSGCAFIIAVDIRPERLALAKALGATHIIDAGKHEPVEMIKKITGAGANYSIESTTRPALLCKAVECLSRTGVCGLIGCAPPRTQVTLDMNSIPFGRTICGITEESSIADVFIPKLVDLYMEGNFPIDRLVTCYAAHQISHAVKDMADHRVINPVLRLQ